MQVIPGILKCADVADMAAMIAPRPLTISKFVAAGDSSVSADEILVAFKRCTDVYSLLGSGDLIKLPL